MRLLLACSLATIFAFAQEIDKPRPECVPVVSPASLVHFRLGECHYRSHSYQGAANEFREALGGDLQPPWVDVWSRIYLGKIFDKTGQRERAINEYRLAERTGDNTLGALEEAARCREVVCSPK